MLPWMAETAILATVLAAIASLAGRWSRLNAATRHALWLVVLLKLVTPPLVRLPLPTAEFGSHAASRPQGPTVSPEALGPQIAEVECLQDPIPLLDIEKQEAPFESGATTSAPVDWGTYDPVATDDLTKPSARPTAETAVATSLSKTPGGGSRITLAVLGLWATGSVGFLALQAIRIVRFRRRIGATRPAPAWLVEEVAGLSARMRTASPRVEVVDDLESPLLWCLGRPRLLIPAALIETLDRDRWRGILAHELAHIRRGDPWVSRLTLVSGLAWWWCPLYWLTRSRLEAEAELACDAWVLWSVPGGRRSYAEALVEVCATVAAGSPASPSPVRSPALGVGGAGHFFERRLTMILNSRPDAKPPRAPALAVVVLGLLALPAWSLAQEEPKDKEPAEAREKAEKAEAEARRIEVKVRAAGEKAEGAAKKAEELARKLSETIEKQVQVELRVLEDGQLEGILEKIDPEGGEMVLPGGGRVRVEVRKGDGGEVIRQFRIERKDDDAKAAGKDDDAKGERPEMKAARDRMQEATRQLREAQQEMMKAQRELMEAMRQGPHPGAFRLEGPIRLELRGLDAPEAPKPPAPPEGPEAADAPAPPQPPAPPVGRGRQLRRGQPGPARDVIIRRVPEPAGDLENRVEGLEKKTDAILEELKALRKELGGKD